MIRSETKVDMGKPPQRADKQSGARHQRRGKRNFTDDQISPCALMTAGNRPAFLAQRAIQVDTRGFRRGKHTKQDRRDRRYPECKQP